MTEPITLTVSAVFFGDHRSRDCSPNAVVVKRTKKTVTVELDADDALDLFSDADYYAEFAHEMGMPGLAAAARSVLRRFAEAGLTRAVLHARLAEEAA